MHLRGGVRARRALAGRIHALLGASAALLAVGLGPAASTAGASGSAQGPPPGPTAPPFFQCPAIGMDTTCQYLIDVIDTNPAVAPHILKDASQPFFDGEDDVTVAIQNDSAGPIGSIHIGVAGSGDNVFGFDNDGLCVPKAGPTVEGCPFGPPGNNEDPFDYFGPNTVLTPDPGTSDSGTVDFTTPLQPGQYTFVSLEAPPPGVSIVAGEVNDTISTSLDTTEGGTEFVPGANVSFPAPVDVTDTATIMGPNAASAEGEVVYNVYSDPTCKTLVAEAGKKNVALGQAEPSTQVGKVFALPTNATYYWQATYKSNKPSENSSNQSACGDETMTFGTPPELPKPTIATTLSGGGKTGTSITVPAGTPVTDTATVTSPGGQPVSGRLTYAVYSTSACSSLFGQVQGAGGGSTTGSGPPSNSLTLPVGTYYFQASYSGNGTLAHAVSPCGAEVLTVVAAPPPPPPPPPPKPPVEKHHFVFAQTGEIEGEFEFPEAGEAEYEGQVVKGAELARFDGAAFARLGGGALAEAAKKKRKGKSKKCKKGFVKKRGKCVSNGPAQYGRIVVTIPAAGKYRLRIKPSGKALAALKKGKTLNVKVTLTFTPKGTTVHLVQATSVKVHLKRKKHHKGKGKGKKK